MINTWAILRHNLVLLGHYLDDTWVKLWQYFDTNWVIPWQYLSTTGSQGVQGKTHRARGRPTGSLGVKGRAYLVPGVKE